MKHFIHITMMTNLANHAIVVPLPSGNMQKKKKSKNFNEKEGNEREGQKYCH